MITQEPNNITPSQALDVLSQIAAQYKGTLKEHQILQQALQVLLKEIKKDEQKTQG